MKDYNIYLFDLDGTLVDTEDALHFVFDESYKSVGVNIDKSHVKRLMRIPLFQGYQELNGPEDEEKKNVFADNISYYVDHPRTMELTNIYLETKDVLNELIKNNKVVGIVTSNSKKHTLEVLDRFDIKGVKVIIGNQECKTHKPFPEPVLNALKELNYQGPLDNVVYIGDGLDDMRCGNNAHVDTILLDRYNEYDNIVSYKKINTLKEIIE